MQTESVRYTSVGPISHTPVFRRTAFYGLLLCLCVAVVSVIKREAIYGGWAEIDANNFHFILINYFIHNGFNWDYPQILPMYPGMHVFFASVARFGHLDGLAPTDWTSFAIQTIWGACYLGAALAIALRLRAVAPQVELPLILLVLLCSSYPIASWIWPTTELGAFAMMYGLYALLIGRAPLTITQSCLFAIIAVVATLFRQNYAVFAVAPIATCLIRYLGGRETFSPKSLLVTLIPVFAVGSIVAAFTVHWGGLVPAELSRHGGAGHIEIAQIQNVIALVGLIGLPFVLLSVRMLSSNRPALVGILVASLGAAVLSELLAPMMYDRETGHWGSLIWTIVQQEDARHLHSIPLIAVSAAGWFVCLTILYRSVIERYLAPEVIMLGLLAVSLLPQTYVYQRYSEGAILATLGVFFLSRVALSGKTRWILYAWYGAYMAVSLARPLIALGSLSG